MWYIVLVLRSVLVLHTHALPYLCPAHTDLMVATVSQHLEARVRYQWIGRWLQLKSIKTARTSLGLGETVGNQ